MLAKQFEKKTVGVSTKSDDLPEIFLDKRYLDKKKEFLLKIRLALMIQIFNVLIIGYILIQMFVKLYLFSYAMYWYATHSVLIPTERQIKGIS